MSRGTGSKLLWTRIGWILIAIILVIEFFIDIHRAGDFQGYINAGNLVLNGGNIYSDYLNTWPPLFSVFSVPLAIMDGVSPLILRALWLTGSLLAFALTVKLSVRMLPELGRFKEWLKSPFILVTVLLSLRYVMDNMANLQINMYLLLLCVLVVDQYRQGRYWLAGLLLAFGISLKVYPVILLVYFLYKREWLVAGYTIFFALLINSFSLMVFGWEEGLAYYHTWVEEVTPRSFIANHKNQSYFGVLLRLLTDLDPDHGLYTNFATLDPKLVKRLTYLVIALAGLYPAYLFRKKNTDKSSLTALLEYSFVLTAIPMLSPIAWKAYYIFLWPGILISYYLLFHSPFPSDSAFPRRLKILFWLSMILVIGTAEIFIGPHFSDVLESWSFIAIGTTILLILQLQLYVRVSTDQSLSPDEH